ncbi:MAG: PqqD family protein [Bacteroidota bacterium]
MNTMRINKNIAISDMGFVFNPTNGESYSVNPIGVEIINLLKEDKTYEEIMAVIMKNYNTDEASFERDYFDFTNLLLHFNLTDSDDEKNN